MHADATPCTADVDRRAIAWAYCDSGGPNGAAIGAHLTRRLSAIGGPTARFVEPYLGDANSRPRCWGQSAGRTRGDAGNFVAHDTRILCCIDSRARFAPGHSRAAHIDRLRRTSGRTFGATIASLHKETWIDRPRRAHPVDRTRNRRRCRYSRIIPSPPTEQERSAIKLVSIVAQDSIEAELVRGDMGLRSRERMHPEHPRVSDQVVFVTRVAISAAMSTADRFASRCTQSSSPTPASS